MATKADSNGKKSGPNTTTRQSSGTRPSGTRRSTSSTVRSARSTSTKRYLAASGPAMGYQHIFTSAEEAFAALAEEPGVTVVDRLATAGGQGGYSDRSFPPMAVIETTPYHAAELARFGRWTIEPDLPLGQMRPNPPAANRAVADPALMPDGDHEVIKVAVTDADGKPIENAGVYLQTAWPVFGRTGAAGKVELSVPPGTTGQSGRLYILPRRDYWSKVVERPELSSDAVLTVALESLSEQPPLFPRSANAGWGAAAVNATKIPPTYRGSGVKIALIDSGVDATHPELKGRIGNGINYSGDPEGWENDPLGSGTHCAGILIAADDSKGITGLAVDAELHILKVMPGGHASDLIRALDYCIVEGIDIAQISVNLTGASPLLAAKIAEATAAGVACIAGAERNLSGITVPAALPGVLAVGAIGQRGIYPADSAHATLLESSDHQVGTSVARFSATGPGVDVYGPGVAVPTTALGGGYTAADGGTVAAAHIAGIAALTLAHHERLRRDYPVRSPQRVGELFRVIIESCRQLPESRGVQPGIPDVCQTLCLTSDQVDWDTLLSQQLQSDLSRAGLFPQAAYRNQTAG